MTLTYLPNMRMGVSYNEGELWFGRRVLDFTYTVFPSSHDLIRVLFSGPKLDPILVNGKEVVVKINKYGRIETLKCMATLEFTYGTKWLRQNLITFRVVNVE